MNRCYSRPLAESLKQKEVNKNGSIFINYIQHRRYRGSDCQQIRGFMTRKDFNLIAQAVRNMDVGIRLHAAYKLADELINSNPNFDRNRFIDACLESSL